MRSILCLSVMGISALMWLADTGDQPPAQRLAGSWKLTMTLDTTARQVGQGLIQGPQPNTRLRPIAVGVYLQEKRKRQMSPDVHLPNPQYEGTVRGNLGALGLVLKRDTYVIHAEQRPGGRVELAITPDVADGGTVLLHGILRQGFIEGRWDEEQYLRGAVGHFRMQPTDRKSR